MTTTTTTTTEANAATPGRMAEFVALYLVAPVFLALALPPSALLPALLAVTVVGAALLSRTPGFAWAELGRGWGAIEWRHVGLVAALTAVAAATLVWLLVPSQALVLPRRMPGLWLMILLLYPIFSALPQELVFRPLFFRRYGALFGSQRVAVAVNAAVFGLAHLAFWNWVAVAMTVAGGAIFAQGYLARGGFAMAVVLHAVCGWIVFTSGLGAFFYHGAVGMR